MPEDDVETEFDSREFTAAERRRLRRQMMEWDRYHWAWRLVGRVTTWVVFVLGFIWMLRDVLSRMIRAAVGNQS